jgi:hypothetical protein
LCGARPAVTKSHPAAAPKVDLLGSAVAVNLKPRVPHRFTYDFHSQSIDYYGASIFVMPQNAGKKRIRTTVNCGATKAAAPLLLHTPVNGLHSIEIATLTNCFFLLT